MIPIAEAHGSANQSVGFVRNAIVLYRLYYFNSYQFFFFLCQLVLDKDYEPMETGSAREKDLSPQQNHQEIFII